VYFRRFAILNPPSEHDIRLSYLSKVWGSLLFIALLIAAALAFFLVIASREPSFTEWLLVAILIALIEFSLIALVGRIMKGDYLAFFFEETTVFDADDITAMSFSAHKSLLRALDNTGIDISKLRLKQDFQGGRRGEKV
jgi:hypothetical protein